jgi:hypothetical protein
MPRPRRHTILKTTLKTADRNLLASAMRLATQQAEDAAVLIRAPHVAAALQMIATALATVLKE